MLIIAIWNRLRVGRAAGHQRPARTRSRIQLRLLIVRRSWSGKPAAPAVRRAVDADGLPAATTSGPAPDKENKATTKTPPPRLANADRRATSGRLLSAERRELRAGSRQSPLTFLFSRCWAAVAPPLARRSGPIPSGESSLVGPVRCSARAELSGQQRAAAKWIVGDVALPAGACERSAQLGAARSVQPAGNALPPAGARAGRAQAPRLGSGAAAARASCFRARRGLSTECTMSVSAGCLYTVLWRRSKLALD